MIALTGAGGFIGSVILGYLNRQGINDIYCFDDLPNGDQFKNLIGKRYLGLHSVKEIVTDFRDISCVIHFGANSSTLETHWHSLYETNVSSTRLWHDTCRENNVPFIFASSAALYGNGQGPLNHYAFSKAVSEIEITNAVVLRLFNVYGPNEYHKGRMASTILHWFEEIESSDKLRIFENSTQYQRDFIWVEDVAKTVWHFVNNYQPGIYDVGTGTAVDFDKIANAVIQVVGQGHKELIAMPEDLKSQYQRCTRANTDLLVKAGMNVDDFMEPWQGIKEYYNFFQSRNYY